ncbi:HD domain-containing phosphohydrolase [Oribacterium sp. WCC10]|uniref:HD domain-containing phosphohydrolase n=1 Tax=Oribacterium sp. WCC10 TaxID=1855343 RepID=UPI0008F35391|nr:HD domain-containing phosphohydrolase [Oribacterium sp. WCC10]SFG54196.1 energy-coupling factor transport system substrate-specific component [Oribacterium sp. WCC10]
MKDCIYSIKKKNLTITLILMFFIAIVMAGDVFAEENVISNNECGTINRTLSVDPTVDEGGFSAVMYNNTNGLPTSEANAITETNEGFIWIGSYSGLVRYDGNTFVRINSSTGISNVISLFVDKRNRLWIGTNDAGLAMMENDEFRQWGEKEGLDVLRVNAIAEDSNGNIYAATGSGIFMVDSDMKMHFLDDSRISDIAIQHLRNGYEGLLYGVTDSGDIFTIRDGAVVSFLSHEKLHIKGLKYVLPDPEKPGYVYLSTDGSSIYYGNLRNNLNDVVSYDIFPLSSTSSMEYIGGHIWLCTQHGIGMLDDSGIHIPQHLPMNNSIETLMTDYSGNLWFTSSRQGVMKIVPNHFSDLFARYDIQQEVVNSTCLYDDKLFVGTDNGLIVLDKNGLVPSVHLKKAESASGNRIDADDLIELLDTKRVRSIIRDSKGRLWISTWFSDGLLCYDKGTLLSFTEEDGLMSSRIRTVYEKKDGSILVVNTGGVSVIKDDKVIKNYDKDSGISMAENLTVTEGPHGEIVLGSNGSGIFIIKDDGVKHITTRDGLSSGIIMRIKRDEKRKLYWLVTGNSISYMTDDYTVHTINGFPYSNNYDLYENSSGDMWILASNGIYVIPADDLVKNENIDPVFYGLDNGLPCIATANSYSELTSNGDLYIASSVSVAKVNIETPLQNVSDLKVAVPFIDADGKRIYPNADGNFTLSPDTYKVTVNSFVYNYSLINPQVTYYLDGFDRNGKTVDRSDLVPVDYTNLRGGTYNFVMQIKDSMGRGDKEVSITITKKKAFYEEPWFYVVAALAFILMAFLCVRLYIRGKLRALEKKNRETMTLVKEITEAFAKMIDMKDRYTNGHSTRVANYTTMLAKELGYDDETVEKYYSIALLHDIGKIGVPSSVLNKDGKLTDDEFELIKSHTIKGYEALKDISIMPELAVGAQAHHERPDGKGYPYHLKGQEIPRVAQIIAVADCFDAMYSKRPYRNRMNFEKVVSIIKDGAGTQLEADVVDAFLRLVAKGEFRAPDDDGGGSMENIENVKN